MPRQCLSKRSLPRKRRARSASASTPCAGGTGTAGSRPSAMRPTADACQGQRSTDCSAMRSQHELSARNRFRGIVREVKMDGLLAQVELETTEPARVVAVITREAAEELGSPRDRTRPPWSRRPRCSSTRETASSRARRRRARRGCGGATGGGDSNDHATVFAAASLPRSSRRSTLTRRTTSQAPTISRRRSRRGRRRTSSLRRAPSTPTALRGTGSWTSRRSSPPTSSSSSSPRTTRPTSSPSTTCATRDVKLVIGAEGVPIGDYTRTVLENMGATTSSTRS